MAKYIGSPFGTIIGKLGPFVCSRYRGRQVVKIYRKTKDPAPLELADSKNLSPKAIKRINCKVIFAFVYKLLKKEPLIEEIWKKEVKRKKLNLEALHLFHKYNTGILDDEIKNQNKLCGPNNPVNTSQIMVSEGILEQPVITNVNYDKKTHMLNLKWYFDPTRPEFFEDDAHILIIHWKIPEVKKWNIIKPWETVKTWMPEVNVKRKDGEITIKLKRTQTPKYSSIHLFFTNNDQISPSSGIKL